MSGRLDGGSSFTDLHLVRELNGVKTSLPKINSGAERLHAYGALVSRCARPRMAGVNAAPSSSGTSSRATGPAPGIFCLYRAGPLLSLGVNSWRGQ